MSHVYTVDLFMLHFNIIWIKAGFLINNTRRDRLIKRWLADNEEMCSHLTGAGDSAWVRCLLLELVH